MSGSARIERAGYRPYGGVLLPVHTRFWIVALAHLWVCWKDKWFRRVLWFSFAPLFVFGGMVVVQYRIEKFAGPVQLWRPHWQLQAFGAMVMAYLAGRNGVERDRLTGALWLYLSRPLRPAGYLLGKWLSVFLPVMAVLWVPQQLLLLFRLAVVPGFSAVSCLQNSAALVVCSGFASAAMSLVMLGIGSLTGSARAAGFVWLALAVVLPPVAQGLAEAFSNRQWVVLSFFQAAEELASALLGSEGSLAELSLLSLAGWALAGLLVAGWRLSRARP